MKGIPKTLFLTQNLATLSETVLGSLPPHPAPFSALSTAYQDSLPGNRNYTRVHDVYLQNGSLFAKELAGTSFDINIQLGVIPGSPRNPASDSLVGPFVWSSNYDVIPANGGYRKNKGFSVGTGRTANSTGHFFQSVQNTAPYAITTSTLSDAERENIFGLVNARFALEISLAKFFPGNDESVAPFVNRVS